MSRSGSYTVNGVKDSRKWKWIIVIGAVITLAFSIAVVCLGAIRNKQLHDLWALRPESLNLRGPYLGHDLSIGFGAFALVLSLFLIIYSFVIGLWKNRIVQAFFIFAFFIAGILLCASSLVSLWIANRGVYDDEHRLHTSDAFALWKHNTAWDWMTQTFYYNYGDEWKALSDKNECCGVRGPYEMGAQRTLWNNQTNLASVFNFPLECCKLDTSKPENLYKCRNPDNLYQSGCYAKVAYPEYVHLGAVGLTLSCLCIIKAFYLTWFYVYNHKPLWSCFKPCC